MQRENFALLQYYLRERLWRHAQTLSSELATNLGDYTYRLWRAFTLDMEGSPAEAIREYKACDGRREVHLAALVGLQCVYRRVNDNEAVDSIEARLQNEDRSANPSTLMQGAALMWHYGDHNRAREMLNRVLDQHPEYADDYSSAQLLRGWVDLTSGRGAYVDKSGALFDAVLNAAEGKVDIDAMLGKVSYLERKNQFQQAQELINKCVVQFPQFTPPLITKAKQLLKVEEWEQAAEIVQRILAKDPNHIEALMLSILYLLAKESRFTPASHNFADLIKLLSLREPRNTSLYLTCGQCYGRLAGGNIQILNQCVTLIETALTLAPNNTDIMGELGYLLLLKGDIKAATAQYKKASAAGDGNVAPLLGLIKCTILNDKLDDAAQQLDFLNEIQTSSTKNAELLYLTALLKWRRDRDQAGSLEKLDQAMEVHRQEYSNLTPSIEMYVRLNPTFIVEAVKEYMQHCRTEPPQSGVVKPDPVAEKARRALDMMAVPGSLEGMLLKAKLVFVSGDVDKASRIISQCIRQDSTFSEAHLLSAKIHFFCGNNVAANQSLEQALSLDFEVKDQPQFNLLRGKVQCALQEYTDALQSLQHALKVVKSGGKGGSALSVQDHVSLYLHLAQVQMRLKNATQAQETIREASMAFHDTSEMGRVTIAHAMLTARTDVDKSLEILRSIPPTSEYFLKAKAQMAQIYLTQRHNRRAFAKCYEELVEAFPSVTSFIQLGEAYTSIQEPEKAIIAFEKARAMDPNNAELAVKIGRALVTTHDYQRAIRYYKDAVAADPLRSSLRHDLATLYWRLGDVVKAETVLIEGRDKKAGQDDLASAVDRVCIQLLLAKIYKSSGTDADLQKAAETLIQARVYQNTVLNKIRGENSEVIFQQRSIAAHICFELGEHYQNNENGLDKAVTFYNEALKQDETHDRAMLALAKLYLRKGELDGCEYQCNSLLRVMPTCEEAIIMLADLMFRKNKFEDAAFHFMQLLEKKPNNYEAMVHFVQLLRRAGRLQDATKVFQKAEKSHPKIADDAGYHYAKGLFHRYTNNARDALNELSAGRSRKDGEWSQKCIIAMIEIYINPENANVWQDADDNSVEVTENVRIAERLLKDVKDRKKHEILEAYLLVASKKKDNLNKALAKFYEIMDPNGGKGEGAAEGERVNVAALVGMATTLQIMKQTPKARNHLKRVAKTNYNAEEDDDYERGWLLLASIYIESGKYDLAQELLKKALQANKSCCRAWEHMGLIYEKEQSYRDAAECYEKAWQLVNETDPGIGYKLAFNYLKAKKHVNAIDVCQRVLKAHPNYPKIKKDVLERARSSIRP